MAFPTDIPSFTAPDPAKTLDQDNHTQRHADEEDSLVGVTTKVGTGASTPTAGKVLRGDGTGTSSWGQVDISTDVAAFASSALRAVLTDETGTGSAVFGTSPTIATPAISNPTITGGGSWAGSPTITTPTIASMTNAQHDHSNAAGGGQLGASAFPANALSQGTTIFDEVVAAASNTSSATFADVYTAWTGGSLTTYGGAVIFFIEFTYWRNTAGNTSKFRLVVDSTNYPSSSGWSQYTNELVSHRMNSRTILVTGLTAGAHTIKLQWANPSGTGTVNVDDADWLRITALELKR